MAGIEFNWAKTCGFEDAVGESRFADSGRAEKENGRFTAMSEPFLNGSLNFGMETVGLLFHLLGLRGLA